MLRLVIQSRCRSQFEPFELGEAALRSLGVALGSNEEGSLDVVHLSVRCLHLVEALGEGGHLLHDFFYDRDELHYLRATRGG